MCVCVYVCVCVCVYVCACVLSIFYRSHNTSLTGYGAFCVPLAQEKNASNHLKDFPGDLFEKIQWSIIT